MLDKKNTTKQCIADEIVVGVELPGTEATVVVETVLGAIKDSLQRGEAVYLRGFGTFGIRRRRARLGRNPRTGEKVQVKAKRVVFFRRSRQWTPSSE